MRDTLCLRINEEPGGWDSPVEVQSWAGVWWRWQVREGIGSCQWGPSWGIVSHTRAEVRTEGGGIDGGKLAAKGSIDGSRTTEGIPVRAINGAISRGQVASHCGVGRSSGVSLCTLLPSLAMLHLP